MAQIVGPRGQGYTGYRIRTGNVVALVAMPFQTSLIPIGGVRVIFDDGSEDDLYFDPSITSTAGTEFTALTKPAKRDGWVVTGSAVIRASGFSARSVTGYGQLFILSDVNASVIIACIGSGVMGARDVVTVGQFGINEHQAVFVFQGTIAEDATAGTHLSTLTVTPGTGNEIQILYGMIVAGAGAANLTTVKITDDANRTLSRIFNSVSLASGESVSFPITGIAATGTSLDVPSPSMVVSGTMTLVMQVSTATVSLTHTFSLVCRLKNGIPSTVLADSVGTPTLTTNTSAVF